MGGYLNKIVLGLFGLCPLTVFCNLESTLDFSSIGILGAALLEPLLLRMVEGNK